jgi:hypothetical protein
MRPAHRLSQSAALLGALLVASSAQAAVITDASYEVSLTHHEFFPTDPEVHKSQTFSGPGSYSFPGISAVSAARRPRR